MSPTIWTITLIGSLATSAIATASAAIPWDARDNQPPRRARMLERFDADRDGRLDQQEREAARGALLKRLDRNGNGHLDPQERRAARQAMRRHMLQRFDRNADGRLDGQERRAAMKARKHRGTDAFERREATPRTGPPQRHRF